VSFSPLFIGEYSATATPPAGKRSNPPLSVPSSSGNTLQHALIVRDAATLESFSPLFIGEYSATSAARWPTSSSCSSLSVPSSAGNTLRQAPLAGREAQAAAVFQSPLHRGILYNANEPARSKEPN